MIATFKITAALLDHIRADLARPHAYAYERVGFLTSGAAWAARDELLMFGRTYTPVDDDGYVETDVVGAQINVKAMRKGLEAAYRTSAALFHVHTHGGYGIPRPSGVDLKSANTFLPSFFNLTPHMPHGIIVLSDDAAKVLMWTNPRCAPIELERFVSVGARIHRVGRQS